MKRPGASANRPATITPTIVPIMKLAWVRTQPRRMAMIATAMQKSVQTVSPWIQLNAPSFNSRIGNEDSVTKDMVTSHVQPTMR